MTVTLYLGVAFAFLLAWFLKKNPGYYKRWFSKRAIREGLDDVDLRFVALVAGALVASFFLMNAISALIVSSGEHAVNPPGEGLGNPPGEHVHFTIISLSPWLFLGMIVVSVVFEEWLFRGIMVEYLRNKFDIRLVGAVSIFSWAGLHALQTGSYPIIMAPLAAMGSILVLVYLKRGLKASVTVHMGYNLVAFLLLMAG